MIHLVQQPHYTINVMTLFYFLQLNSYFVCSFPHFLNYVRGRFLQLKSLLDEIFALFFEATGNTTVN